MAEVTTAQKVATAKRVLRERDQSDSPLICDGLPVECCETCPATSPLGCFSAETSHTDWLTKYIEDYDTHQPPLENTTPMPDPNKEPTPESILQEAERLVNGPRAVDYGPAKKSFKRIADITNLLTSQNEKNRLTHGNIDEVIVCKVLMALKLARQANKPKRDNLVDLAGYAHLLDVILEDTDGH